MEKLFVAAYALIFALLPASEFFPGTWSMLWTALTFAVLVGTLFLFKVRAVPLKPFVWLAIAALAGLGILTASDAAESLQGHLMVGAQIFIFMAFGPFALSSILRSSRKAAPAITRGFLLGQSVSAAAAVLQATGMTTFGAALIHGRATGLAGHPNILGVVSGVAFVLVLFLVMRRRRRGLLILVMMLNLAALLLSGSISALIATVAGTVVLLIASRVKARVPILVGLVGAGIATYASNFAEDSELLRGPVDRIKQVTGQTSDTATWGIRQNTYQYALDRIADDPLLGRGLDDASGLTYDGVTLTHNLLLRSWMQGGLGMGLAFALLYLIAVAVILRAIFKGQNPLSAGLLVTVLGFALTSAAFQQGYFWLLVLAAWALVEHPRRKVLRANPKTATVGRLSPGQRRSAAAIR